MVIFFPEIIQRRIFLLNIYPSVISNLKKTTFSHILRPIATLYCSYEEKYHYLRFKKIPPGKSTIFSKKFEENKIVYNITNNE